jgi:hypothetical protein
MKQTLTLLFLFSISTSVFAARPFMTDDAGTVDQHAYEAELSADSWKNRSDLAMSVKHGLTPSMDLGIGMGYCALPEETATTTPLEIGFKYALIPDKFALAVSTCTGHPEYAVNTVYSQPLGLIAMDANLGVETLGGSNHSVGTFGLAFSMDIGRFGVGLETVGTFKNETLWQIGGRYAITDWLVVDTGFYATFDDPGNPTFVTGLWTAFPSK